MTPTLFVENEDSFSWNVLDSLPLTREQVVVRAGREVLRDLSVLRDYAAVVVGPGPGNPEAAGLAELVLAAARLSLPLLGICLGHQALCLAFGARVIRAQPMHGKQSPVTFGDSRLFPGFRGPYLAMRYHSLVGVDVPPPLRVIATTADDLPMAVEHETLPMAGLQFHPDSYATPYGREMIADFFRAVR